jgi:hypothetical protein
VRPSKLSHLGSRLAAAQLNRISVNSASLEHCNVT